MAQAEIDAGPVHHQNDFYRTKFDKAKITPGDIRTYDDFRKLPIMNKEDLLQDQAEAPPYGGRLGIDRGNLHRIYLTSGTTGKGQEVWTLSREERETCNMFARLFYMGLGIRKGDIVANTFPM